MLTLLNKVDHLVLAVPELEAGINYVYNLLGAKAQIGGQHKGKGTWNALLGLGRGVYLEIIAPDPRQHMPDGKCWMGVEQIKTPKLIHWAAKVNPIRHFINRAQSQGLQLGPLSAGSRTKLNGEVLSWMLTDPVNRDDGGIIPFLIDWENSIHPANGLAQDCKLLDLKAQHPNPEIILTQLEILDIKMKINSAAEAQLSALIQSPNGEVLI